MRTEEEVRSRKDRLQNELLSAIDVQTTEILAWRMHELEWILGERE